MNKIHIALTLFLCSSFFFACQKDTLPGGGGSTNPEPTEVITFDPITANLQGNITDENNLPVEGAAITAGSQTAVTDANGYFRINGVSLDKNVSLVTAEMPGYFKSYRVFAATSGTNQVAIKLAKRTLAGTIKASSGGKVTLANGATISLPANGVVVASSGAAYAGDVSVYSSHIDPTQDDIGKTLPGSSVGNNRDGKRVVLASYGILAVELQSADGQKLQMASGSVATLSSPIPSSLIASAPDKLSLAYLDEQTGIWKEEGAATKSGTNYVGDVQHFTDWNYDTAYNANASLTLTVHTKDGAPLVNVPVNITAATGFFSQLYTDSLGVAKGYVPLDQALVMELPDDCSNAGYTQTIAPLSKATDLGVITINQSSSVLSISGTLLDCNSAPVTKGYASIIFNHMLRYAATNADGQFSISFVTCTGIGDTVYVAGINNATGQESDYITLPAAAPVTQTGTITVCGAVTSSEFIEYTIDSSATSVTHRFDNVISDSLTAFTSGGFTSVSGGSSLDPNYIAFGVSGATTSGSYPFTGFVLNSYSNITMVQPGSLVFTSFPSQTGEYYEGTFAGEFTADGTSVQHSIKGSFKMKRIL